MPATDPVFIVVLFCFVALMALAALSDIRAFTIPNRLNLGVLAMYPVYVLASPQPVDWTGGLLCGLAAFGIGAFMFAMRWIGGGDVKMMAVAAVWAGPALIFEMSIVICVVGGIYSILEGIRGGYPGRYWRRIKASIGHRLENRLFSRLGAHIGGGSRKGSGVDANDETPVFVPYGVAIFIGGFFVAANLLKASL